MSRENVIRLKDLQQRDPRFNVKQVMNIFKYDMHPYLSLYAPERDLKRKDSILQFVLRYYDKILNKENIEYMKLLNNIHSELSKIYDLESPIQDFRELPLGEISRISGVDFSIIENVLSGALYNGKIEYLLNLKDAIDLGFIKNKNCSYFATLNDYYELQSLIIRAMINDGEQLYQTAHELSQVSKGMLYEEELLHPELICLNEHRYLEVRNILLFMIKSNPIVKKSRLNDSLIDVIKIKSILSGEEMTLPYNENPVYMPKELLKTFINQEKNQKRSQKKSTDIQVFLTNYAITHLQEMAKAIGTSTSSVFSEIISAVHTVKLSSENQKRFNEIFASDSFAIKATPRRKITVSLSETALSKYKAVTQYLKRNSNKTNSFFGHIVFYVEAFYQQFKSYNIL